MCVTKRYAHIYTYVQMYIVRNIHQPCHLSVPGHRFSETELRAAPKQRSRQQNVRCGLTVAPSNAKVLRSVDAIAAWNKQCIRQKKVLCLEDHSQQDFLDVTLRFSEPSEEFRVKTIPRHPRSAWGVEPPQSPALSFNSIWVPFHHARSLGQAMDD